MDLLQREGQFVWPKNGGHDDQGAIHTLKFRLCIYLDTYIVSHCSPPADPPGQGRGAGGFGERRRTRRLRADYAPLSCMLFSRCQGQPNKDQSGDPIRRRGETSMPSVRVKRLETHFLLLQRFSATGLMILELNWLDVYKYEKWNAVKVPVCKIGDKFTPKKLLMVEGRTTPPEPINESDLITEMDKNGIGTDATIAR